MRTLFCRILLNDNASTMLFTTAAVASRTDLPTILHEDNHILVVQKPSGMLTQGGEQRGDKNNLLDIMKKHIKITKCKPGEPYLGLVHRLDLHTSGIVVFGKTSKASGRLSELFSSRKISKRYTCMVQGRVLNGQYLRNDIIVGGFRTPTIVIEPGSKYCEYNSDTTSVEAILQFSPLLHLTAANTRAGSLGNNSITILDVTLDTGRKHQIRSQLAAIGHPIVGDTMYGAAAVCDSTGRTLIALHNYYLGFPHIINKVSS